MNKLLSIAAIALIGCSCSTTKVFADKGIVAQAYPPAPSGVNLSGLDPNEPVMIEIEEFDEASIKATIDAVEKLKANNFKHLWFKIDSYGGSVHWGQQLSQSIENYGSPVTCVVDTKAMSMGFYFLQTCDTRLMTKRSSLMAHEPSTQAQGKASQLDDTSKELKIMMEGFIEQCLTRMTVSEEYFKEKTHDREWYMDWKEATDINAIDGTISPKGLPKLLKIEKPELNLLQLLFGGK